MQKNKSSVNVMLLATIINKYIHYVLLKYLALIYKSDIYS